MPHGSVRKGGGRGPSSETKPSKLTTNNAKYSNENEDKHWKMIQHNKQKQKTRRGGWGSSWHMRAGGHLLGPNGPGGVSLGAPGSTRNHGEAGGSQAGGAIPLPRAKSPGTLQDYF